MWIKQDNELTFTPSNIEALQTIPNGNWLLKFNPVKGFYLEKTPGFKFPKKIYGDSEVIAKRYLNTFKNQSSNLGILLTGLKGTGKSVTAKITCDRSDLPVVLITEPFTGDGFKSFLSNITQEVIIFIDEFEKVYYDTHLQNSFLSILDGIFEGKKIFLFTSNEKGKINQYMINRPGRVHYLKEYDALDESIINDVIDDNLIQKENKEGLLEVLNILSNITMDMLISLIKEMNLYKETARQSIRFLNLKPDSTSYNVEVYQNDLKLGSGNCRSHPLTAEFAHIEIYASDLAKYTVGATNHDALVAQINFRNKKVSESVNEVFEQMPVGEKISSGGFESKATKAQVQAPGFSNGLGKATMSGESEGGWIHFDVDIKSSKIEQAGKGVTIIDKNDTKFIFKKETYYVFSF